MFRNIVRWIELVFWRFKNSTVIFTRFVFEKFINIDLLLIKRFVSVFCALLYLIKTHFCFGPHQRRLVNDLTAFICHNGLRFPFYRIRW